MELTPTMILNLALLIVPPVALVLAFWQRLAQHMTLHAGNHHGHRLAHLLENFDALVGLYLQLIKFFQAVVQQPRGCPAVGHWQCFDPLFDRFAGDRECVATGPFALGKRPT